MGPPSKKQGSLPSAEHFSDNTDFVLFHNTEPMYQVHNISKLDIRVDGFASQQIAGKLCCGRLEASLGLVGRLLRTVR